MISIFVPAATRSGDIEMLVSIHASEACGRNSSETAEWNLSNICNSILSTAEGDIWLRVAFLFYLAPVFSFLMILLDIISNCTPEIILIIYHCKYGDSHYGALRQLMKQCYLIIIIGWKLLIVFQLLPWIASYLLNILLSSVVFNFELSMLTTFLIKLTTIIL